MRNNPFKKKSLSIHAFIHASFEGIGCIGQWIMDNKHFIDYTLFYEHKYELPNIDNIDWLIVMGGPMSVNNEEKYPWLVEEKQFIRTAIEKGKTVIGICLGAQLIASALGAAVYKNKQKEIGWLNVEQTEEGKRIFPFSTFGERFKVFHFHGETFDLPEGSTLIYSSEYCKNQAFAYKKRVLGFQFHLETTTRLVHAMIEHCHNEFEANVPSIQTPTKIVSQLDLFDASNQKMYEVLDFLS